MQLRKEAIEHAQVRAYGAILLARPLSAAILSTLFGACAAGILAIAVFGHYTHAVDVPGSLAPTRGVVKVTAPRSGVVTFLGIRDGQRLAAGERLVSLASSRFTEGDGNADASVARSLGGRRDSLLEEGRDSDLQSAQRIEAARVHVDGLGEQAKRVSDRIDLQRRRVAIAQEAYDRYEGLQAQNFVSDAPVRDKLAELLSQKDRLSELEGSLQELRHSLDAARGEVGALEIQARRDKQASRREVQSVDQALIENEAQRSADLRSTIDGVATAVMVHVGQYVSAEQPLASVVPSSGLEAHLFLPSRSVGFIHPGMRVRIRYQAYAYQRFGQAWGTVRAISDVALAPAEIASIGGSASQGAHDEPMYVATVDLDRQDIVVGNIREPLRPGAQLEASIPLETRRIYQWLLGPIAFD